MLKRLLTSTAIISVLLGLVFAVYWWRSLHGHVDNLTLGRFSPTQSHFYSENGRIWVEVIDNNSIVVTDQIKSYAFRNVLGYFLILPCFWIAVTVRRWLPRPPGRGFETRPRRQI